MPQLDSLPAAVRLEMLVGQLSDILALAQDLVGQIKLRANNRQNIQSHSASVPRA